MFHRLSTKLSRLDNDRLLSLPGSAGEPLNWSGNNSVIRIGRSRVFVKRVAVTETEYDNMYSTRNLYRLPMYYQYGVGSAGFGVFREIAANVRATNWVLDGSCQNFAMMYHHRVVPLLGRRARLARKRLYGYVRYWNGNANVGRYIEDRTNAQHEAILFFEYVPYVLSPWLDRNMDRLSKVMRQMQKTIAFLHDRDIVHFDCHFWNILTDGERMYLVDFGVGTRRTVRLERT